ncbi:CDP-glucose 4,6-dehydratase [Candidatus Allofournierella excrementavium]|uniref:CDP-glucose 4,6-dehydratase n=1 Tax=Candidatus Allofournierella excrementavium TaxID=2838591 RepID=UPI003AB391A4
MNMKDVLDFYKGKRVFITGHTGFKGSWLCQILLQAGAEVWGYSLAPEQESLFTLAGLNKKVNSTLGDVRDFSSLKDTFKQADPEIVLHLAAQPIVRTSYKDPRYTYETNVMGTVNLLECVRSGKNVASVLNVTTDKVYCNNEWLWGYREIDPLDGFDPYSNSKSCSELVTHSYVKSFFQGKDAPAVSTARAGNVIGGGDFAPDRIIPDCVRAVKANCPIFVRNPNSIRPYQHVLEPLFAYLMIVKEQCANKEVAGWYNVGPDEEDCVTTGQLVELFCKEWGDEACWEQKTEAVSPHEANFLMLDCSKIKRTFQWKPRWHIQQAVKETVHWSKTWMQGDDIVREMEREIVSFGRENDESME